MSSDDLEEKLLKWDSECYRSGIDLAKAEADYNTLEEQKDNFLSLLMGNYPDESETGKKRLAKSSTEWVEYIKGWEVSRTKFLMAKALHNGAKLRWETARVLIYKRAGELRRLG